MCRCCTGFSWALCMCVRLCDIQFYWILFALQQLSHKSLHHYKFLLLCSIDSHCAERNSARFEENLKSNLLRMEGRERVCFLFVYRVLFMCISLFSMQAKWIYGEYSSAFGTIITPLGAWHIQRVRPANCTFVGGKWKSGNNKMTMLFFQFVCVFVLYLLHPCTSCNLVTFLAPCTVLMVQLS